MAAPSQFKSNYKAMRITARHGHPILHPVTGTKVDEVKELTAEFGVHRGEFTMVDETGAESTHADIAGFFYDLDADAAAKGWTADEKEAMRRHLILKAESNPDYCQIYSAPSTSVPWPTYDKTHHSKVASLAADLGLVEQALAYESENKNRPSVVEELQKAASASVPVEELTAA